MSMKRLLAAVVLAVLLAPATAQAAYWTPGKTESYLVRHYANIDNARCKGTPGRSIKQRRRARKWNAFHCVAAYSNGNIDTLGAFPRSRYSAYVIFF
ncbi:MAG: hypothetical protein H0W36_02625 [Gemmatimonadetes bacterium]|nr:hypothetical protein [Gemmatimonadota bacterium]